MAGFETAIEASKRQRAHDLDRAATDIVFLFHIMTISNTFWNIFMQHPNIISLFLQEDLNLPC